MYNDESMANYFLRVDEIVNCMKKLGEEIKEVVEGKVYPVSMISQTSIPRD